MAPNRGHTIKVLLRQPQSDCFLDDNIELVWETTGQPIPDWQNPPAGLEFPD